MFSFSLILVFLFGSSFCRVNSCYQFFLIVHILDPDVSDVTTVALRKFICLSLLVLLLNILRIVLHF
jgi:hypothetical protein